MLRGLPKVRTPETTPLRPTWGSEGRRGGSLCRLSLRHLSLGTPKEGGRSHGTGPHSSSWDVGWTLLLRRNTSLPRVLVARPPEKTVLPREKGDVRVGLPEDSSVGVDQEFRVLTGTSVSCLDVSSKIDWEGTPLKQFSGIVDSTP